MRNVANRHYKSHTDPIFKHLSLLKFTDLVELNSFLFMHKFAYGRIPPSINSLFDPLAINSRTGNYKLPKYKQSFFDKFPTAFLPKLWNQQQSDIKNNLSYKSAKNKLTDGLLSKYENIVQCCYANCPDCTV